MTTTATPDTATAPPDAEFFALKGQLLAEGREDTTLAGTDLLKLRLKVYASGGENAMHRHTHEDHAFVVLAGQATFHINSDDNVRVVNKGEGVMLPKHCMYWFQSSAPENLVMLRVGAGEWPEDGRRAPDGHHLPGKSAENKHGKKVALEGQFFSL